MNKTPDNITVHCEEALAKARAFADRAGIRDNLEATLTRLARPCGDHPSRVSLGKDFAPYSFSFYKETQNPDGTWSRAYNGGVIYSGPHDGGDGNSDNFTVRCGQSDGWNIHT